MELNDIHSALNRTRVARVLTPTSKHEIQSIVRTATRDQCALAVCGARHAMGGQQFATDQTIVDTSHHRSVIAFDQDKGLITVAAGMTWPAVIQATADLATAGKIRWSIRQKQTGADDLTLGGALSANIHGRGLRMAPFVSDVERFTLIDPHGTSIICDRTNHAELFALAIGGYGLFGIISDITLRLMPRTQVQRTVSVTDISEMLATVNASDCPWDFGDFQFSIDETSSDFLHRGVFRGMRRWHRRSRSPQPKNVWRAPIGNVCCGSLTPTARKCFANMPTTT